MKRLNANGFSLLEVLITIILVSIGLLGMVAMQGRAIQYTQDSIERTNAATLASELLEIVRASPSGLLDDPDDSPFLFTSLPASVTEECLTIDADDLVENQVGCWAARVRALLPDADSLGSEFLSCISSSPGTCDEDGAALEIRLAWNAAGEGCLNAESEGGIDEALCTFTFRTQI